MGFNNFNETFAQPNTKDEIIGRQRLRPTF